MKTMKFCLFLLCWYASQTRFLYHKHTFTGLYTFMKTSIIRFQFICSKNKLNSQIEFIVVLIENGHLLDIEQYCIHAKIAQSNKPLSSIFNYRGLEKLALDLLGKSPSMLFFANLRLIFTSQPMLKSVRKDVLYSSSCIFSP